MKCEECTPSTRDGFGPVMMCARDCPWRSERCTRVCTKPRGHEGSCKCQGCLSPTYPNPRPDPLPPRTNEFMFSAGAAGASPVGGGCRLSGRCRRHATQSSRPRRLLQSSASQLEPPQQQLSLLQSSCGKRPTWSTRSCPKTARPQVCLHALSLQNITFC